MNRIDQAFARAREEGRAALIVFITAGDPDLETSAALVPELAGAGADIVELGIPHSDPIAEGPTIQASSERALRHATQLAQILALCRRLREVSEVPLVLMGYVNNVLAYGEETLVQSCAAVGVDGLIVADVPYAEAQTLQAACEAKGVHRILLVAPTSTPERIRLVTERSRGFVYLVSVTGITGPRERIPSDLAAFVRRVRAATDKPLAVGFGISTPDHVKTGLASGADGVISGSAVVGRVAEGAKDLQKLTADLTAFVQSMRAATI